jgi:hypothetical protein
LISFTVVPAVAAVGVAPVADRTVQTVVLVFPTMKQISEVLYVIWSPTPILPVWAVSNVIVVPLTSQVGVPVLMSAVLSPQENTMRVAID